ncbi:bifunctional tetrahydrofolate synthase/dihydrofolate synthase [Chromatiaceae bacterium AAb-1]|nr:bifunctional tetrahydrofolate synthase/dihydrofolate synthase [Chromatiaceae bacterium AAb-1]
MSVTIQSSQSCQTLTDWLCYIEQRHPVHQIELGLSRIAAVAIRASLAILPGKKILIGGTNGKGTTARCLEQLLLAQGFSTGVYSSPHLLRFNERLRINEQDVSDEQWVEAFAFIEQLRQDTELTYFEFTTLASFYILKQADVDFCLIEVGLGGRLDATNIIEPDISVITTVDLDHQDFLGNSRELIGYEKAGIFRAARPAVVGELLVPQSVYDAAAELGCQLSVVNQHYHYQQHEANWSWQGQTQGYQQLPRSAVPVQNMATSLTVLEQLGHLPDEATVRQVLPHISLAGRMQWLQQHPAVIVDVAHNPQSAQYLAEQLTRLKPHYRKLIAFTGMLKDKDIAGSLLPLTALFDKWHLVSLGGARGASAAMLAQVLAECTAPQQQHEDVVVAYSSALSQLQQDELLVVFGSFITVSAVLASYNQEAK